MRFPACAGLYHNLNDFCIVDENEKDFWGREGTSEETMHYLIKIQHN